MGDELPAGDRRTGERRKADRRRGDRSEVNGAGAPRLRPRTAQVRSVDAAGVAVVEAPGGTGKSTLLAEIRRSSPRHVVAVSCRAGDADPAVFAAALVGAAAASGLAVRIDPRRSAPADVVDDLLAVIRDVEGGCLVVVDDAHLLSEPSGALLLQLASDRPDDSTLVVAARRVPAVLAGLRRSADVVLTDRDLAFSVEEVQELGRDVGVNLSPEVAGRLVTATGGSPAALLLATARISTSADPAAEVDHMASGSELIRPLVESALGRLDPPARVAARQFARLPFGCHEVAAALGRPGLIDELRSAGLPVTPVPGGWYALAGPVADLVAGTGDHEPAAARAAAGAFSRLGRPLVAATVLVDAGLPDDAAALVADLPPLAFGAVDHAELDAVVASLPADVVGRHPGALLQLARTAHLSGRFHRRTEILERARSVLADGGDPPLARAVGAELTREQVREGDYEAGRARALALLAECGPGEESTRAACLHAAGAAAARLGDARAAERYLDESIELYHALGDDTGRADALIGLGYSVYCWSGEYGPALDRLRDVLRIPGLPASLRAATLSFLGETYECAGNLDDAEHATRRALALAERLHDRRLIAFARWELARIAAGRGDTDALGAALREVEAHRGDWFDQRMGAQFLADAAELWARVGVDTRSADYLRRAVRHPHAARSLCLLAEAAVEARRGDPCRAVELLDRFEAEGPVDRRAELIGEMLRAAALHRAGDGRAAAAAVALFEHADSRGNPALPHAIDLGLARTLVGLATGRGSLPARRAAARGHDLTVEVLGRCFVSVAGRAVRLPPGLAPRLVGRIAVARGRCPTEVALDALWPDEAPDRARVRLRKLLSRLNGLGPTRIVERDGDSVTFPADTVIDAVEFEDTARRALTADGDAAETLAQARLALSRYRGELLPDEPYADWAIVAREGLVARRIALIGILADDAERRGDLIAGLQLAEDLVAARPDEEEPYVRAARLLIAAGQTGRARFYLARAEAALGRLGLRPGDEHARLTALTS